FRIEQVVSNLFSNALRYGTGNPVQVVVRRDGEWARVEPLLAQRPCTPIDLAKVVTDTLAELTPWIIGKGME
ncbi:ATP-binding protein, partial [Pseudomonas otitidis]